MPLDWTDNEDCYMAEYRGEAKYDRVTPDHGQYPGCDHCEGRAIAVVLRDGTPLCEDCAAADAAPPRTLEELAQDVVDAAYDEAYATLDADPAHRAEFDYNLRGEAILVRRIAAALAAAAVRRAA